ncbi:GNAT family N-acetyltransferase [Kitasatospora sp. NBC_01287]|uniref:GNAT family N-acetyltransferase n=1 Tax=Kitasatospora sp. NBC_01287 TaxID=2903573 RepID=UPI00224E33DD|nr:GNAT family N-acetyltransferase [Kitasatospora sp. NBC_01287]MCX4749701.1 GNAT family N-acetyltransferase [Kitasatospora sp. NBC_01287]
MTVHESTLRRFDEACDSVAELTALLHRAYAEHAAAGRVFLASYQSERDTAHRLGKGECWLAVGADGAPLGTVTLSATDRKPQGYPREPGSGSFWQLAVLPEQRGTGLGNRLLELAERRLAELGSRRVVIDTSSTATELLGWYARRGYRPIGSYDWAATNYLSTVLRKELQCAAASQLGPTPTETSSGARSA